MVEQQPGQVISPNDQPQSESAPVQNTPQSIPEATSPAQQSPVQQPSSVAVLPTSAPLGTQQSYDSRQNTAPTSSSTHMQTAPQPAPKQSIPTQEPSAGFMTSGFDRSDVMPVSDDYSVNETANVAPISWTASEYIAHNKNPAWFLALAALVMLVSAGVYFLTKDILSGIVIILVGIVFGMYAGRKPHEQTYAVNEAGVVIGDKLYGYDSLRSFTAHQEDAFPSITFMPFGRFMPPISMYYAPQDEERIIAALSVHLPYETYKRDLVDALMRKIRF